MKHYVLRLFLTLTMIAFLYVLRRPPAEVLPAPLPSTSIEAIQVIPEASDSENTPITARPPAPDMKPWDAFAPLDDDEKAAFNQVEEQIQKYLTWGHMDAAAIPAFRQTLFRLGERGVADLGRRLSALSTSDVGSKEDAARIIQEIDLFSYLTSVDFPLAHQIIQTLATRPVRWNDEGKMINGLEATITFEAFDLYARAKPSEALRYIDSIAPRYQPAYLTHFAYGRRLAGVSTEAIDHELRLVFPHLAQINP